MTLLYPWMLFFLLPLYALYKSDLISSDKYKARQKKFLYLALLFMLIALSRPVITKGFHQQRFDAEDFIIALDSSYSMQADDLKPTRYIVAKNNIATILKKLNKDRFALFTFTTNAMLISPPTTDTEISMLALNSLEPRYILTKGTSLRALFETIAKTSYKEKKLLIFSDGGEDRDLEQLIAIAKEANIIPYIVAVASNSGATLKKNGKTLKDEKNNLVISRINPILKPLAYACGGEYYELTANKEISEEIISEIKKEQYGKKSSIKIMSYTELYYLPLLVAMLLFFTAVTKFHQLSIFIPLFFLPHPTEASTLFDFSYHDAAKQYYKEQKYDLSAKAFKAMTPTVASYYNSAVAYYRAKKYKKAMEIFTQIETPNPDIKQKIYYNMGNCAVKLKKYKRAKIYYQKALALGDDKDAYNNLLLLYKLKLKEGVNISDMLPKNKVNRQTGASKKEQIKKSSQQNSSKSQQKASQKSSGSGSKSSGKDKKELQQTQQQNKAQYKIGYRAYELINKGYTNEKHPW